MLLLLLLGLIYWGLSRLEQRLDTPPEGAGETVTRLEKPERPVVYYDGARYTEKDGLVTLLILGIDDAAPTEALGARNTSQADFAALAVFDPAEESCTHVVMEVSSHSLALERVAGLNFDVAVFTNLSQDHLDLHGTMDEYAAAKKKIFSQCKRGCVNIDDQRGAYMADGAVCPILRYSAQGGDAELRADDVRLTASGVSFTAVYGDQTAETHLAIPGMFSVYNALSVLAACLSLGMSLKDAAAGISSAKGVKGRMESVPTDGDYSIIIDYSHKPDALEKALKALRPVTRGRLIALFGCGGDRDRLKRPIMGRIAAENADFVIVTSDNPRTEEPMDIINEILPGVEKSGTPYKMICDRPEAIRWAIDNACPGDVILLAGKGHEDYQIIGHEKHHMDEREIVADWLEKRKERR